ncbi:hypothetical protein HPB47_004048, partial [Ixodes persulcatus]
ASTVLPSKGLKFLQPQGGTRFMSSVTSISATNRLVAQENLQGASTSFYVSIYRLPPYVTKEAVVQAIALFANVRSITYVSYRDRPDILTGTRAVKVEMTKPIPNFVTIQGHQVMVDYPGADRKGISGQPARPHAVNVTPFSDIQQRPAPPLVCGAITPTLPRTIRSVEPTPLLPTQRGSLTPPAIAGCRKKRPTLAPGDTPSGDASSEFSSVPYRYQESDVADSSPSPGLLVIAGDTDLTPGQRGPPSRSDLSPSTQ